MKRPLLLACLGLLLTLASLPLTARAESGSGTVRQVQALHTRLGPGQEQRAQAPTQAELRVQTPPAVLDNTQVSPNDSNIYSETAVTFDPTTPANLLAGSNIINLAPMASFASSNGGTSWVQGLASQPAAQHFSSDPGPAFNALGNAYYTYIDVQVTPQGQLVGLQLLVSSSLDKGQTWGSGPLARIDTSGDNPDKPLPAVDTTAGQPFSNLNRLYVAYDNNYNLSCTVNCPQPMMVARADPPYTSWTRSTVFTGFGNIGGYPAVGPDGSVYVLWDDYGSTTGGQIVLAKSQDGGSSWGVLGTTHKVIANTTVGFGIQLPNYSSGQARPVGPAQAIDIDRTPSPSPTRGYIYTIWGDAQPTRTSRMHIYFSRSTDGGATWSSPARLDGGNVNDAWQPTIAVDQSNGRVTAAWYDRRDDGANTNYGVYYTQSNDGGVTWLPTQVPVAQVQSDPRRESLNGTGDYMMMVATGGKAHPVWADSRNGRMQVFTATINENGVMTVGGPYNALKRPFRLLDTRVSGNPLGPNSTFDVQVTGRSDPGDGTNSVPPSGVGAAVINLTAVGGTSPSYLTLFPQGGGGRPLVSNVNFLPGQQIANLAQVALGGTGKVSIYNSQGSVDVLADIIGYYSAVPAPPGDKHGLFNPKAPVRIADSRSGLGIGAPLAGNSSADLQVSGANGIFLPGTSTIVANLTAVDSVGPGYLAIYPQGSGAAGQISNVNFPAGRNLPNRVMVGLGPTGKVTIYNGGTQPVHVLVDLNGFFTDNSPAATGALFRPFTPVRLFDTRGGPQLGPGGVYTAPMAGNGYLPTLAGGLVAVAMNTTVTNASSASFLAVYPDDVGVPNASDLNFAPGDTIPNLVIVKVGAGGAVKIYNNLGSVDLLGDLSGYFS